MTHATSTLASHGSSRCRLVSDRAPHVLMLVGRESARNRSVAERLRREAGVTVDIVQADLEDAVDIALVGGRLQRDGRIGVLVNNSGVTFMVAFPSRSSSHAR